MRIRSIKPEFWKSDDTASLKDWSDRLVFIGLWSYVDDNGVGRDNERLISAELFALEEDPLEASARVRRALATLSDRGLITRYQDSDGRKFLHITNWHHQKIDKPTRSSYPLPTSENVALAESSPNPPRILPEDSAPGSRDLGIKGRDQGNEDSSSAKPMVPPKYPPAFLQFWDIYPRKVGKDSALKAWNQARRKGIDPSEIIAGARRLVADPNLPDENFVPHPTTWIRRGGWGDAPYPAPQKARAVERGSTSDQRVTEGLELARRLAEEDRPQYLEVEA